MTIGIDLRAIGQGKYSGVEEYTLNLLDALFAIDSKNKYLLFSSGQSISNRYLEFSREAKEKNFNINLRHCFLPNRILNTSFKLFSWPKIDKLMGGADIVFAPNINLLPVSGGVKIVATIHDLSFAKYKEFFSARQNFWHSFVNPKALAKKADCLIAVSESTKQDLVEIYGIRSEKIKVIYSGIVGESKVSACGGSAAGGESSFDFTQGKRKSKVDEIRTKYNLPDKYILYLGTIEPRKNIFGLIKAFELFKKSHLPLAIGYKLVIAGSKGWLYENIFYAARNSSAKNDIIFTDFVADEDKTYLYQMASLFVYPSFYEGFGFPPLEAMAAGIPVITSDCSSLPEVVGEAGLMTNPYNISRLAWAIGEVLNDEYLRGKMIAKGYEQVKKFSWEKCARETLNVIEEQV